MRTNFIPIYLYSNWKDPDKRKNSFLKSAGNYLAFCLVFLLCFTANSSFGSNLSEYTSDENCTSITENHFNLFYFDKVSSITQLTGTGSVACNSHIYVSLNERCGATITADMILEGVHDDSLDNYMVNILDGPRAGTDSVTIEYLNQRIRVEVIDTTLIPNNKCWGYITVEDKIAPILTCTDTTVFCNTSTDPAVMGGQPTVVDACTGNVNFTYSDVTQNFTCRPGTMDNPDTISIINRTWQGTDLSGNSSTCSQTIYVVKPQLRTDSIIWPSETILYCGDNPSIDPSAVGYPLIKYNGDTLNIDQFCLVGLSHQDQEFTLSNCAGTRKILRTWTLFDWCHTDSIFTNALFPGPQLIKIQDTIGPVISDLPINTEIQVSFPDLNSCAASVTVPPIQISDVCSPNDSIQVTVKIANITITTNGGTLINVPFGTQDIIYTATDDCGNVTTDTVVYTIHDNIAPTVICKENLVVSLNQNGTAQVRASAFNNGSYDNCQLDSIRVRRMDSCGVAMTLPFAEFVSFQCCDVGEEIMVELSVWDTSGNSNSCMVRVQVQDKVAPTLICPSDMTVNCDTNLTDLSIFGAPAITGNTCNNTPLSLQETVNLNNCGAGTITRTWTVPNTSISCTQTITVDLVPNNAFNITKLPEKIRYVECGSGLDITNLPEDDLQVESIGCQLLAVSYSQRAFTTPGDCPKVIRTWETIDWCRNPTANPNLPGYRVDTQIVKLIDTIRPTFVNSTNTLTVSADPTLCASSVTLDSIPVTDNCATGPKLTVSGIFANTSGGFDTLTNATPGVSVANVKVGSYNVIYTATDGCNNSTSFPMTVIVQDTVGPVLFCDDLVTTLTINVNEPENSDARGFITVWASDFNCKISDCDPSNIRQVLRFPSQGIGVPAPPADTTFGWTFTCGTKGTQTGDLWVMDGSGNWDYVRVTVEIQDNMNLCPPDTTISLMSAMISGSIETESGEKVEDVTVNIEGYSMNPITTGIDGNYEFGKLPMHNNYVISPEKNMDPLNGVSTFDLVLISKHILGISKLDSPYKQIAADINRSGSITAYDLVQLRQLVLNISTEFSNNTSWRFVNSNYQFISDNPAAESFTEVANFGDLDQNTEAHFVAVKIGDVNANAIANRGLAAAEGRNNRETLSFATKDVRFEAGEQFNVDFNLSDLHTVEGYQFTLSLDPAKVEIVSVEEGIALNSNFGTRQLNRGMLTTSWNQGTRTIQGEERMFGLVLRAKTSGTLSQVVEITSDLTSAEAYNTESDLMNVALNFESDLIGSKEFTLYNNRPNPFRDKTVISFELPEATNATLTIFDISGRIMNTVQRTFDKGYNEVQLDKSNFKGSGIYFYELATSTNTAKKKMILID